MSANKINTDLFKERQRCSFDVAELTHFLDGGADKTNERRKLEQFFLSDPDLKTRVPMEYLSHKEKYEEAVRLSCILFGKINKWLEEKESGNAMEMYQSLLGGTLGSAILKEGCPFTVHYVMFIPTLMGQGTIEQQSYWISRAFNCEIIATYAQTELGHGTHVRGLETTATYDPNTEEFVMHSPTITAYKWWPGGLGHTCNYAVVLAQLYTEGKCYGIHPFVVQLRDEETFMPLPGIKIGEIGCKLNMNTTNNGYLGFEHVRIPRNNMLMKNSKVLKDGTYVKSQNEKLTYGTMIFVRVVLIRGLAAASLAKAVTIAVRYSAVRRQSELKPGDPEPQILDFHTQQYKLFPAIATVYAMRFAADWLWDVYNSVTNDLEHGDLDKLPELHAMSCCLKAVSTFDTSFLVELCRLSCGGHGYMTCSSMPNIYGLLTAAVTYEGEYTVMLLQTARYLIKFCRLPPGKLHGGMIEYVTHYRVPDNTAWSRSFQCVIKAFQQVAAGKIIDCANNIDRLTKSGLSFEEAWNETSIRLTSAAEAHCRAFLVEIFVKKVKSLSLSEPLHLVLTQLCQLYAVFWILKNLGDFLVYSNLKKEDIISVQSWLEEILEKLRPNAVGIVDAFDFHDDILCSALGSYDGNVYERLFAEANKSPINAEPVSQSFHKYLKPFLKSRV